MTLQYHEFQALVGPGEKIFHVLGGVFLGSEFGAVDETTVRGLGIKHIINCTAGSRKVENKFASEGIGYTNFELHDQIGERPRSSIDKACELIPALEAKGLRVLVHCSAGLSRSVTVILGYLMKVKRMSLKEAVEATTAGRGRKLMCNASFWSALLALEREMTGKPDAPPSFDFTDWAVQDLARLGLAEEAVRKALVECKFDADAAFSKLFD